PPKHYTLSLHDALPISLPPGIRSTLKAQRQPVDQSDKRTARSRLEADTVLAHAYPTKPVRLIEPFGAGGGPDLIARALAQKLSEDRKSTRLNSSHLGIS